MRATFYRAGLHDPVVQSVLALPNRKEAVLRTSPGPSAPDRSRAAIKRARSRP
jgi:hypothetical protein